MFFKIFTAAMEQNQTVRRTLAWTNQMVRKPQVETELAGAVRCTQPDQVASKV